MNYKNISKNCLFVMAIMLATAPQSVQASETEIVEAHVPARNRSVELTAADPRVNGQPLDPCSLRKNFDDLVDLPQARLAQRFLAWVAAYKLPTTTAASERLQAITKEAETLAAAATTPLQSLLTRKDEELQAAELVASKETAELNKQINIVHARLPEAAYEAFWANRRGFWVEQALGPVRNRNGLTSQNVQDLDELTRLADQRDAILTKHLQAPRKALEEMVNKQKEIAQSVRSQYSSIHALEILSLEEEKARQVIITNASHWIGSEAYDWQTQQNIKALAAERIPGPLWREAMWRYCVALEEGTDPKDAVQQVLSAARKQ